MKKTYCPICKNELEVVQACGSVSFFCNDCNELISSKKILDEEDIRKINTNQVASNDNNK